MGIKGYKELFKILRDSDLLGNGPIPKVDRTTEHGLREAIEYGASFIPGLYHDTYVQPLLRNLQWVRARVSDATMETLAGAIYDHGATYDDPVEEQEIKKRLYGFLAVISNLYRSFIEPEPSAINFDIPTPHTVQAPLATFRPKLDPSKRIVAPFTLPANEVERLCGGKVAIVSIPSAYRSHPVLCWGAIAHEVGGHDILHAYPGLLLELGRKVREEFYKGDDPKGQVPESKEQFLGLLWQYWTEEAASDVCAVLNLGPAYGKGLAIFLATMNERIPRWFKENKENGAGNVKVGKEPLLTLSWPPFWAKQLGFDLSMVDSHPTDILKLHVVIGAIESLPLVDNDKKVYIDDIKKYIDYSLKIQKRQGLSENENITISGMFTFKPGKLLKTGANNKPFKISRLEMEACARKVGRFIAKYKCKTLNNHGLQDLETWDKADEALAKKIKNTLMSSIENNRQIDFLKTYLGDDAQLLAGSLLTILENPRLEYYEKVNKWLGIALMYSWYFDPTWRKVGWYPLTGGAAPDLDFMDKHSHFPHFH